MKIYKGKPRRSNGRYNSKKETNFIIVPFLAFLLIGAYFWPQGTPQTELFRQPDALPHVVQVKAKEIEPTATPRPASRGEVRDYIYEVFGEKDAKRGIKMLETCENSTLSPTRVSGLNIQKSGRRSYDVGVWQINADESDKVEIEKLKNHKYNTDRAYAKFKAKGNTFYLWSCGHVANDRTYVDALKGK